MKKVDTTNDSSADDKLLLGKNKEDQTTSDVECIISDEQAEPSNSRFQQVRLQLTDNTTPDPVFRRNRNTVEPSVYESLDYDVCENVLWRRDHKSRETRFINRKDFARWIIFIFIGIVTAIVACILDIVVEEISGLKHSLLKKSVDDNVVHGDLCIPYILYILTNIIPVAIGSYLVTFIEPAAAGSGIPLVKCYLNGVKVPRIVRIKTLAVKIVGVATSVIGGLACGKEGPMIHAGAIVAAGISQGKSTTFKKDFRCFRYFRDDHEKRDFVVGGASAGVAAAFGAPLGGVLFSLEEAASFWNQTLIWRTLVSSIISSFTLNVILSAYHGLKSFSIPGLFNLGEFEPLPFEYFELPIFVLMGLFGGLMGALWNFINTSLSVFRKRFIRVKICMIVEAMFVAAITATIACIMMYSINDCRPLGVDPTPYPVQLFCEDNEYNAVAALWFQTPEATVKSLFHDPPGSHKLITLAIFVAVHYPLSFWTYGLSVSIGIFIPTLLVGAAWGRLTAMLMANTFPNITFIHPSKYALIGAAAQLGGVLRMSISLTVILVEATGNISFALPLVITLMSAKWMGDYFNHGIYDSQIIISKVPLLPWNIEKPYEKLTASNIMSTPPVCIKLREKTSYIIEILKKYPHNAFPVVDMVEEDDRISGRLRGLILRSQLIVILKRSFYKEKFRFWKNQISIETFRDEYPRYPAINDIIIHRDKIDYTIDSEMFMNPSPYTVWEQSSVTRVFQMFRALGLRHIIVVNLENQVSGIITRKDFMLH